MTSISIAAWFRSRHVLRFLIAVVASIYFAWATSQTSVPWLLNNVNFVFHEAGHIIFIFFGTFISVAGGTLTQIFIPIICIGYFCINKKYYSASLLLFWLSQSILNASVYAGDAVAMRLPLVGGDYVIHDWNYMLSTLNILAHTEVVASFIRFLAILILLAAVILSLHTAKKSLPIQ
jgi:hypothetical protein